MIILEAHYSYPDVILQNSPCKLFQFSLNAVEKPDELNKVRTPPKKWQKHLYESNSKAFAIEWVIETPPPLITLASQKIRLLHGKNGYTEAHNNKQPPKGPISHLQLSC